MKNILTSLIVVGLVSFSTINATKAYFSDVETSTGNTFSAGKLDLDLGSGNPLPFSVSNLTPGDSGTGKVTLTNVAGSLNGNLDVKIANMVQAENGLIEPELAAGDYDNGGDLDLSFVIAAYIDVNRNGVFDTGDIQLAYGGQKSVYPGFWGGSFNYSSVSNMLTGWDDVMSMTSGQSVDLIIMWQLPTTWTYPAYNQNIVQTDSLGFDVQTSLEQAGGNVGVAD